METDVFLATSGQDANLVDAGPPWEPLQYDRVLNKALDKALSSSKLRLVLLTHGVSALGMLSACLLAGWLAAEQAAAGQHDDHVGTLEDGRFLQHWPDVQIAYHQLEHPFLADKKDYRCEMLVHAELLSARADGTVGDSELPVDEPKHSYKASL